MELLDLLGDLGRLVLVAGKLQGHVLQIGVVGIEVTWARASSRVQACGDLGGDFGPSPGPWARNGHAAAKKHRNRAEVRDWRKRRFMA